MLRHSMFSDSYLSHRNGSDQPVTHVSDGSLALSPANRNGHKVVLSRSGSRTWWETGWQLRR